VGIISPLALRITCQRANPWRKPTRRCRDLRERRNRVVGARPGRAWTAPVSPQAERAHPSRHVACCPAESGRVAACLLPDHHSVRAVTAIRPGPARARRQTRPSTASGCTPTSTATCAADTPGIGVPRSKRVSGLATLTASTPSQEGR